MDKNLNILPEKIVRTTDSEGKSFFSEIYSIDAWGDIGFIGLIFILFIFAIFAPVFAALVLLFYCLGINGKAEGLNVIGVLTSAYVLFDLRKDWFISQLMTLFYDLKETQYVIYINAAMFLTHLIMLFIGNSFYNLTGRNKFISFVMILVVSLLSYYLAVFLIENNIINVKSNAPRQSTL